MPAYVMNVPPPPILAAFGLAIVVGVHFAFIRRKR